MRPSVKFIRGRFFNDAKHQRRNQMSVSKIDFMQLLFILYVIIKDEFVKLVPILDLLNSIEQMHPIEKVIHFINLN